MLDAERSAGAPNPLTVEMDRQVMAYLLGQLPLEAAVSACVRALGPRPLLSIQLAHADATMRARLDALRDALRDALAR
ncbi:MAG: hypothetical protein C0503_01530 [Gemmatimonas sp.]|nr:hypothetical protein [Gemmatimonas sp.]